MPERAGRPHRPSVVVVGGGITGLATAWFLRNDADVTLLEASDRLGGKIRTVQTARPGVGVDVEAGPDTFLARVPHAIDLCRDLGLGGDLVEPATGKAFVWTGGELRPLPADHVLGVPIGLRSLACGPAWCRRWPWPGPGSTWCSPARRFSDDPTVAEVIGRRMGRGVLDRLVEPLVGGINAGRADGLSLAATAPQLAGAATGCRSLVLGLRRNRRAAAASRRRRRRRPARCSWGSRAAWSGWSTGCRRSWRRRACPSARGLRPPRWSRPGRATGWSRPAGDWRRRMPPTPRPTPSS